MRIFRSMTKVRRRLACSLLVLVALITGCGVQKIDEDTKIGRVRFMVQRSKLDLLAVTDVNIPTVMAADGRLYRLPALISGSSEGFAYLPPSGEWYFESSHSYKNSSVDSLIDLTTGAASPVSNFGAAPGRAVHSCEDGPATVTSSNSRFAAIGGLPFAFKKDRPVQVYDRKQHTTSVVNPIQEEPCHRLLAITNDGNVVIRSGSKVSFRRSADGMETRSFEVGELVPGLLADDLDWMEIRFLDESQQMVILLKSKLILVNLPDMAVRFVTKIDPRVTVDQTMTPSEVGFDEDTYAWARVFLGKITLWTADLNTGVVRRVWSERWSDSLIAVQVASPDIDETITSRELRRTVRG